MTKTIVETLAKFQEIHNAIAKKYQCEISILHRGKKTVIVDSRKKKKEVKHG